MGDIDALKSALELDDAGLYTWATKEYRGDTRVSIKRAIDRLECEEEDSDE